MNSILLTIAVLCQRTNGGVMSDVVFEKQVKCQQVLMKCARSDSIVLSSDSGTEAKLAQCVLEGVHLK